MVKISSLLKKLTNKSSDYPHLADLTFVEGEIFSWNHTACAISYDPAGAQTICCTNLPMLSSDTPHIAATFNYSKWSETPGNTPVY